MFRTAAVVASLAVGLLGAGCQVEGEEQQTQLEEAEQPEQLVGQQITVTGEVTSVIVPGSFVLAGEEFTIGPDLTEGTLVVGAQQASVDLGNIVRVTGTVFQFQLDELTQIEEDVGFDIGEEEDLQEFDEEFGIRAESVEVIERVAEET